MTSANRLLLAFTLLLVLVPQAAAGPAVTPLVSAEWLAGHLEDEDLRVLDIRAAPAFSISHIPGAVRTDYPGPWRNADWSLPAVAALERTIGMIGIGQGTSVVIVPQGGDSTELGGATWLYWVLRYLGHDEVAILDGGWRAWSADGARPEESGAGTPSSPVAFVAAVRPEFRTDTAALAAIPPDGSVVIVDARPAAQYRGDEQSPLVSRAGHIPGALSLDNARFYDAASGGLKPMAALAAELPAELGDRGRAVVSYCNTGHWSSINWFVLHELLGFRHAVLYDGSMAAWGRTNLPVTTGSAL